MYEGFYGLSIKPFSMMPDPSFLYLSKKHQAALTLLEYGLMNNVGFCVISGEIGAGKTTLLRKLLERVDNNYTVGMITNTHQSFGSLLDWVLSAFNQHDTSLSQVEKHQKLMDFLIAEYAKNKKVLLIVDEAQNMKADALEELRMLSNVNSEKDMLMQVILAGQPALKKTLRLPELGQFAQRIGVDYHLGALNAKETCHYIQHRLRTVGAGCDIFTVAACERIYNYSGGTPRLINLLCDTVMVYGFADQSLVIDADLVEEMVHERMKDSVVPLVNRDVSAAANQELLVELERDFPHIGPNEAVAEDDAVAATGKTVEEDKGPGEDKNNASQATDKSSSDETKTSDPQSLLNPVEVMAPQTKPASSSHFGLYAIILGLVTLVAFFLYQSNILKPSSSDHSGTENTDNAQQIEKAHQAEQAMKQEKQQLVKQAETLRHERDEVIARMQQEKKRAQKAALEANTAIEAAALVKQQEVKKLAAKARQHERQLQAQARREKRRMLEQQRLTQQAEKKAREEAVTAKKHAAELARQQYQKQQDANQRMEAEKQAAHSAVPVTVKPEEKIIKFDDGCIGPAARFKSTCR